MAFSTFLSICSLEHCRISRNGTADIALGHRGRHWPQCFLLLPVYPRHCRMLASPMSTQTALCAILSMMASACTPPPSLGCQSFFLKWVQNTVEAVLYLSSISSSSMDLNSVSGLSSSHSSITSRPNAPYLRTSLLPPPAPGSPARGPRGRAAGCSTTSPSWRRLPSRARRRGGSCPYRLASDRALRQLSRHRLSVSGALSNANACLLPAWIIKST